MENKDLIAFMPEEDLAVEGRAVDMNSDSNIKVEVIGTGDNIVTEEDKAEDAEHFFGELERAVNLGILSPVDGMGRIRGILDDSVYARIIETADGDRYLEFCEQYENGKFSHRFKVWQDDLFMAARCGFQPQTIKKGSEPIDMQDDVKKFMKNLVKEYCRKYNGNRMHNIVEILTGLFKAYKQLPVEKEDVESEIEVFYKRLVSEIRQLTLPDCFENKSYYVLAEEDIDGLARKFKMTRLEFLRQLKEYNLLYLTLSSKGYQTNVRLRWKGNLLPHETAWRYCIYNLEYLNSRKEEQMGIKRRGEEEDIGL